MQEPLVDDGITLSATPLYDPVCVLDINKEVASGYLILLLGAPDSRPSISPTKRRRSKRDRSITSVSSSASSNVDADDGVVSLAFMSLTDGNVLNACFGAPTQPYAAASPSYQMARNARSALATAAHSSDGFERLAVETYARAFRIVVDYNNQVAAMSPCTRCFKQAELHKTAEEELAAVFLTLSEAVTTASS